MLTSPVLGYNTTQYKQHLHYEGMHLCAYTHTQLKFPLARFK